MGKAIVIQGLVVTNPVAIVTFESVDNILAAYYQANSTISASEKTALEAFIGSLSDSNLWGKVKYFYPMLGNSVADMKKEVVNPATEDILATDTEDTGLSIDNRILVSTDRSSFSTQGSYNLKSTRFGTTIDCRDLSIIASTNCVGSVGRGFAIKVCNNSSLVSGVGLGTDSSGYRSPMMEVGDNDGTRQSLVSDLQFGTYKERIIMGDYNGDTATLYKEKDVLATGTNYVPSNPSSLTCQRHNLEAKSGSINYNFIAITSHLTAAEWEAFYDLLVVFLKAVGKHS